VGSLHFEQQQMIQPMQTSRKQSAFQQTSGFQLPSQTIFPVKNEASGFFTQRN
jgi:hypothetical protein